MRLLQLSKSLLFVGCLNIVLASSSFAKSQESATGANINKDWVLTSSVQIINTKEIARFPAGKLLVVSVTYFSSYDETNKLRGFYIVSREEVECASKSSALRVSIRYSLSAVPVLGPVQHYGPIRQSFPETVAREHIEKICRLAEFGPKEDDITFATIADFIRNSEMVFPPKGPEFPKASPKSKPKPR